ncbi:DUF6294 family protein [Streptosporangium sp. G12]
MNRSRFRMTVGATSTLVALALGPTLPSAASSTSLSPMSFTWSRPMTAGNCTMFEGARWTLYPSGRATFDGTVTSGDDNDAWLMWARLKDENNAVLGTLTNVDVQDRSDPTKFVQGLPSSSQRYRWFASGEFKKHLFPLIKRMSLAKHC